MKKTILLVLFAVLPLIPIAGSGSIGNKFEYSNRFVFSENSNSKNIYTMQIIKARPYTSNDAILTGLQIIKNKDELNSYIENNKTKFSLNSDYSNGSEQDKNFETAIKNYNDAFFKDNLLALCIKQECSGSLRYKLNKCKIVDDVIIIKIDIYSPGQYLTSDIAYWHIIIESPNNQPIDQADFVFSKIY